MEKYYEGIYIFRPNLEKTEIDNIIAKLTQNVNVDLISHIGKKKLAYELRGEKEGYYILIYFTIENEFVFDENKELQNIKLNIKTNENILKHIHVHLTYDEYENYINENKEEI